MSLRELKHVEKARGNRILQEKTQRRCRQRRQRDFQRGTRDNERTEEVKEETHIFMFSFLCHAIGCARYFKMRACKKWEISVSTHLFSELKHSVSLHYRI